MDAATRRGLRLDVVRRSYRFVEARMIGSIVIGLAIGLIAGMFGWRIVVVRVTDDYLKQASAKPYHCGVCNSDIPFGWWHYCQPSQPSRPEEEKN
jgi:hypothetical protein